MEPLEIINWMPNSPTGNIILGFIAVLLLYLAFWLIFEIIKLAYWIISESLRATFFGLTIMHYTLAVIFVTAPIGLIFQKKDVTDIINKYFANIKMTLFIFYPKLKEKKEKKESAKKQQNHQNQQKSTSRSLELNAQTEIIKHNKPSSQTKQYFCTNCGKTFTPAMINTLNRKEYTFCESCGKKFLLENGSPSPVSGY